MKHSVKQVELKNGAKGLLINVPGARVVNLVAGFNSGNLFCDSVKFPELSHVMEHVMVGANKQYPTRLQFESEIEKNGAYTNAFTNDYFNWYEYESADYEALHMLELLTAQLTTPLFLEQEVITEIGNVREELNNYLTNYERVAYDQLAKVITKRPTYEDSLRTLASITPVVVRNYYRKTHTAKNMRFIFAGAISPKLLHRFEELIKDLPVGSRLPIPVYRPKLLTKPVWVEKKIPQVYYEFVQYAPEFAKSAEASLAVIRIILTGRYNSWILGEARERGLAYTVQSNIANNVGSAFFSVGPFATPKNITPLFKLITRKIKRLLDGKVTDTEVEEAKQLLLGRRIRQVKTPDDLLGWYFYDFMSKDEVRDFDTATEELKQVTPDSVIKSAHELFKKPLWGVALVGNLSVKKRHTLHNILRNIWE